MNYIQLIKPRIGETKLGEKIAKKWQNAAVKYVLLGITEDIGVRVNGGVGGTHTAWQSFLMSFLNIQSTEKLSGEEIGIFGELNFEEYNSEITSASVNKIDNVVEKAIQKIAKLGKIPIVIGGGHNNAYPIIKGISKTKKQPIHTINLDAHSDFRVKEGRHSGNGFRYAYDEGFLKKYAVIGLHENYNSQNIISEMEKNPDIGFCYWEDIFLREKLTYLDAIQQAIYFTKNASTGIELDMDCIENVLSSAMSPCGVSPTQARQYIHQSSKNIENVAYLHICEGATELSNGLKNATTGKLISYLVSDFMKNGDNYSKSSKNSM
jgi:formiminoglutamase